MDDIYWKKLSGFDKLVFSLGWLSVLNLGFWIVLIIHNNLTQDEKFWTPKSYRVVYVFGWINFIGLLIGIVLTL